MGKKLKTRYFPKKITSPPSDLEYLSAWADRLELHLEKDNISKYSSMIFRPCPAGNEAIMKLENSHPVAIRQVKDFLDFTENQYTAFIGGDEAAKDNFPNAMFDLVNCIKSAVKAILAASKHLNSANTSKLFSGKIPNNTDLVDLVVRLDTERGKAEKERRSWNAIARDFTGETADDCPRANSLLSSIRRLKRQGRVNL